MMRYARDILLSLPDSGGLGRRAQHSLLPPIIPLPNYSFIYPLAFIPIPFARPHTTPQQVSEYVDNMCDRVDVPSSPRDWISSASSTMAKGKKAFGQAQAKGRAADSAWYTHKMKQSKLRFRCGIRMMEMGMTPAGGGVADEKTQQEAAEDLRARWSGTERPSQTAGALSSLFTASQQLKMRGNLVSGMKNLSIVFFAEDRILENRKWLLRAATEYRTHVLTPGMWDALIEAHDDTEGGGHHHHHARFQTPEARKHKKNLLDM